MTIRSMQVWLVAAAVAVSAACDGLNKAKEALAELMAVQRAVQQHVGSSAVRVTITSGTMLTVTVTNSPLRHLPAEQKKARTRSLARIAFDAYRQRDRLGSVHVVYLVRAGFLFFTFSDGTDAHRFEPSELRDAAPAPGPTT